MSYFDAVLMQRKYMINLGKRGFNFDMIRICIVEDEVPIAKLISMSLTKYGYNCTCVYDGLEAADLLERETFDLLLLDIMLPGADGYSILEYSKSLNIPTIFITAKNALEDRVKGLRMGAEDYIVKPFEIVELVARVEVVLRRYHKLGDIIEICGLTIDTVSMTVKRGERYISLTNKEYELLVLFARNPNIALYRETIHERVWGGEYDGSSRTVDLHIQRLRKKTGLEKELVAIPKVGYRLGV